MMLNAKNKQHELEKERARIPPKVKAAPKPKTLAKVQAKVSGRAPVGATEKPNRKQKTRAERLEALAAKLSAQAAKKREEEERAELIPPPPRYEDALAVENERIFNEVSSRLYGYLTVGHPSARDVILKFGECEPPHITAARISRALGAIVTAATHSRVLNTYPALKLAFWRKILSPGMTSSPFTFSRSAAHIEDSTIENERFPEIKINFYRTVSRKETLMDHLLRFMTTPVEQRLAQYFPDEPRVSPRAISFGFEFADCNLSPIYLLLIQRFLDDAFGDPDRQFGIASLDFSRNQLNLEQLGFAADTLAKADVYQLKRLVLRDILRKKPSQEEVDLYRSLQAKMLELERTNAATALSPALHAVDGASD